MSSESESTVIIQRRSMNISPNARLTSYNHHALAPWLEETEHLTPMFLYRKEQEIAPYYMGRWLSPRIQEQMLQPPVAIYRLSKDVVRTLLQIACEVNYYIEKASENKELKVLGEGMEDDGEVRAKAPAHWYFIRMTQCSPKDADGGNLQPVFDMREALVKLVSSKRIVQALLMLHFQHQDAKEVADDQMYFFPYHSTLDRMCEWRCYVNKHRVVAISQSRFYQCKYPGITDDALHSLALKVRRLWSDMALGLKFDSSVLDVYAEVLKPDFSVKLIEINPWGAHLGSGSLLFHWLDDSDILEPKGPGGSTVVRLVQAGDSPTLSRDEAFQIGRSGIIDNELCCLQERELQWVLEKKAHSKFMALTLTPCHSGLTMSKDMLETFRLQKRCEKSKPVLRDHPRFIKLETAYQGRCAHVRR